MSIKLFCEQLPAPTSRETPLVFYTFFPLKSHDDFAPSLTIPEVKSIRQYNDVAAAYDWSKNVVGLFFYIKTQLMEYQHILQTAQCSTTIMQQHLKSNLLEFLCTIRSKLIVFRSIEELKNILDQIDSNTSSQSTPAASGLSTRTHSASGDGLSLGFSHLLTNMSPSNEASLSPGKQPISCVSPATVPLLATTHRAPSASPMQLIQQSIRIYLRSYLQPYEQLKKCEQDVLEIIESEFHGQLGMLDDLQPFANTLWLSHCTKPYSSWIHRADKFLKDLLDLHESFRKDRLLSTYNRLQSDSHFRRRKNLEQIHAAYVRFANEECYPNLVQLFHDYNQWIQERSKLILRFQAIQQSYEKQCEDIMNYVEMIDELRQVVYKNIRELVGPSPGPVSGYEDLQAAAMAPPLSRSGRGRCATADLQWRRRTDRAEIQQEPDDENSRWHEKALASSRGWLSQARSRHPATSYEHSKEINPSTFLSSHPTLHILHLLVCTNVRLVSSRWSLWSYSVAVVLLLLLLLSMQSA